MTGSIDCNFKINFFSILFIVFLCIIWPLSIALFFQPPMGSSSGEIVRPILDFYLPTSGFQLLVLLLAFLVSREEDSGIAVLGYRKFNPIYVIYAIIFIFASSFVLRLIRYVLEEMDFLTFRDPSPLLPHDTAGKIAWIFMCLVVAITEETVYRGYLITRLQKIFKSVPLAVIVATAGFAAGHLYQGIGGAVLLFFYGLMFALLYLGTRSLWPCVLAHFLHNALVIFLPGNIASILFFRAP